VFLTNNRKTVFKLTIPTDYKYIERLFDGLWYYKKSLRKHLESEPKSVKYLKKMET